MYLVECVEGIDGIPCYGYGVIRQGETVEIPYPVDSETEKQAVGKSFHHGRFIQKLREAASSTEKYVFCVTLTIHIETYLFFIYKVLQLRKLL